MLLESYFKVVFHKYDILLNLDFNDFNSSFVNGNIFFLFKISYIFLLVLLKKYKTFSCSFFHNITYVCFLFDKMCKLLTLIIHREYTDLFWLLNNFLDYYWLNSNILSFSDDITIPQSLFLHTFSWDLSLFSVLKKWR